MLQLFGSQGRGVHRPTEPHALAWGPTNIHTKIFQLERHRLKIDEKAFIPYQICTYRISAYSPTCCINFTSFHPRNTWEILNFLSPRGECPFCSGVVMLTESRFVKCTKRKLGGSFSDHISLKLAICSG